MNSHRKRNPITTVQRLILVISVAFLGLCLVGYAAQQSQLVKGRIVYTHGASDQKFSSAKQACDDWVRRDFPQDTPVGSPKDEGYGQFRCFHKDSSGNEIDQVAVYQELACPENSRATSDGLTTLQCECDSGYVASGGKCTPAPDTADTPEPTPPDKSQTSEQASTPAPTPASALESEDNPQPGETLQTETLKELAPANSDVRIIVTLTVNGDQPVLGAVTNPGTFRPRQLRDPVSGQTITVDTSPLPAVGAQTRVSQSVGGGVLVRPAPKSKELQIVTWNTKDPKYDSNASHAERQFADWFEDQKRVQLRLRSISIFITKSPCGLCTDTLCQLMTNSSRGNPPRTFKDLAISNEITASLEYENAHTGKQATTVRDIKKLEDSKWKVSCSRNQVTKQD